MNASHSRLNPVRAALAMMFCCAASACAGQASAAEGPATPEDQGLVFVEQTTPNGEVFVGQPVHVRLTFGLEQEFLEQRAVQPFGVALDVPVQLHLAWLEDLAGATDVQLSATSETEGPAVSFALNGQLQLARRLPDRVADGRTFQMYALDARFLATSSGDLELAAPLLSFAYATQFRSTLLDERAPVDRVDAFVIGDALALTARALPETGRPFEFTGAVGDLRLRAELDSHAVVLGETLKLRLVLEGDANLEQLEAPRWRDLGGFRVLGMLDEFAPGARTLTLDLAPVSAQVWQVPEVSLPYFDPGPPAAYRLARSEPIEVRVLPGPERPARAEPLIPARPPRKRRRNALLLPGLVAAGLLLIGALILRRAR